MRPTTRHPQARTRLARRAVLDAALALFTERGYGATTVEAISESSGVPTATVYRLFASKSGILKALVDTLIAGDQEPVAVADRPAVRALLDAPDPVDLLRRFAALTVAINARAAPAHAVLVSAAGSDPDAARILTDLTRQRQEGQARVAAALSRARALRAGLRRRDAADLVHALASPELYRLLVVDRGWPADRYERWLAGTLADQLLP